MWRMFFSVGLALGLATTSEATPTAVNANAPRTARDPVFDITAIDQAAAPTVKQAMAALKAGRRQHGLHLLQMAEKAAPDDWRIHYLVGRAMLEMNYPASAEKEFRTAREENGNEYFVLPGLFVSMLQRQEAQNLLDEFPDPGPNAHGTIAAFVLRDRAEALSMLGRAADARSSMDRSLSLRRDLAGLLTSAKIALKSNDSKLATQQTDEALRLEPQNGHALGAKLKLLIAAKDDNGVLAVTDRIDRIAPADPLARSARIDIFLKRNQVGRAQAELDVLKAHAGASPITRFYNALMMMRANNAHDAWGIAQGLQQEFVSSRPFYAMTVAQIAISNGFPGAGEKYLIDALNVSPDSVDLRARLASIQISQNDTHDAIQVLAPVRDLQDPRILIPLAQIDLKQGNLDDAMARARKVAQIDPNHALPLFSYAVWAQPNSAEFADAYGCGLLEKKDTKGAVRQLSRAHGLAPADGEIAYHYVEALHSSGDARSASALLKELVGSGTQFPDLPAARRLAAAWHI